MRDDAIHQLRRAIGRPPGPPADGLPGAVSPMVQNKDSPNRAGLLFDFSRPAMPSVQTSNASAYVSLSSTTSLRQVALRGSGTVLSV